MQPPPSHRQSVFGHSWLHMSAALIQRPVTINFQRSNGRLCVWERGGVENEYKHRYTPRYRTTVLKPSNKYANKDTLRSLAGTRQTTVTTWLCLSLDFYNGLVYLISRYNYTLPDGPYSYRKYFVSYGPEHHVVEIREADLLQNGWIFGKVLNVLRPPPLIFGKSYCKLFRNSWPKYLL